MVGVDVVKISGYSVKRGWNGQVGGVQHVHMYSRKMVYRIRGELIPHCNVSPSLGYKRDGSLLRGRPFCVRRVHHLVLGFPFSLSPFTRVW